MYEHTALVASVFSPADQVPDALVAETPALRKKTSSLRATAGLRRKLLLEEIAKQKKQSTSKLAYMDPPLGLQCTHNRHRHRKRRRRRR